MKNILFFFSVLFSFQLSAQKYPIEFKTEYFTIVGRQFHVDTVIDGRSVKSDSVGIVKIGLFDYAYVVDRGPGFKAVYPTNPSYLFAYSAGIFFTFK